MHFQKILNLIQEDPVLNHLPQQILYFIQDKDQKPIMKEINLRDSNTQLAYQWYFYRKNGFLKFFQLISLTNDVLLREETYYSSGKLKKKVEYDAQIGSFIWVETYDTQGNLIHQGGPKCLYQQ
jgi:antitoxin component YwqK of YwqJK toxin-antitoxin module